MRIEQTPLPSSRPSLVTATSLKKGSCVQLHDPSSPYHNHIYILTDPRGLSARATDLKDGSHRSRDLDQEKWIPRPDVYIVNPQE